MDIIIRRHATTESNKSRRYTGSSDVPLCEEGIILARRQPKRLDVNHVFVSGLVRTATTARILYPAATQHPVAGLDEMNFGAFEGRSWEEMKGEPDYAAWMESGGLARCPGGEDRAGFIRRCRAAFGQVVESARALKLDEVHIVAHGGTMMALLSEYGRPPRDYYDWLVGNCAGYRLGLEWEDGRPALHLLEEIIAK